jgi:hypothetical protein
VRYRGSFVRATGVLIEPLAVRRIPRNNAEYENAWRGILVDSAEPGTAYAFDLLEKPGADFEARKQALELEGIFCQLVTYSTRGGNKVIPYIAAKNLTAVQGNRISALGGSSYLIWAAVCLAMLPFVGFAVSAFTKGREDRRLVAAVERARSRPRPPLRPKPPAQAPGEGPPAGSAPPAPTDPGLALAPPPPEATDPKPPSA